MKHSIFQIMAASALLIIAQGTAHAHDAKSVCSLMPENDLYLMDNLKETANINEGQFNQIVDEVIDAYAPIAATHGATLSVDKRWTDPTVNASADQSGSRWKVSMYGGLARRPEITPDAFSLVVCHEVGHHLGGFPFYTGYFDRWAATEGQSDYFAGQACAHLLWSNQPAQNSKFRTLAPTAVKTSCDIAWKTQAEQDLCYRTAVAGKSLATLLGSLGGEPNVDFSTPDTSVVKKTNRSHPDGQCRLDTYFQATLCTTSFDNFVIPGKDHPSGNDSIEAEQDSDRYTCGGKAGSAMGVRPACWFKSKLHK